MTERKCPIAWSANDGPYPCAFYANGDCKRTDPDPWAPQCIPMHKERFYYSLMEAHTTCPQCGEDVITTMGEVEKYPFAHKLCKQCSEKYMEQQDLAAHVRGDI